MPLPLIDSTAAFTPMQWAWMDPYLVVASIAVALLTCAMSMQLLGQAQQATTAMGRHAALGSSSLALSGGIWCMHFIGMLAFGPCADSQFDPLHSLLSVLPILLAAPLVLQPLLHTHRSGWQLLGSGTLFGVGVGCMHFWGLAAADRAHLFHYQLAQLLATVALCVLVGTLALLLHRWSRQRHWPQWLMHSVSGMGMGVAVAAMHYAAMAGIHLPLDSSMLAMTAPDTKNLGMVIATATVCVLLVLLIVAVNLVLRWRQLYEQVQRSEARVRAVFETAVDGIVMIEHDGTISSFNPAAERLLGWQAHEVLGRNVHLLMPESERAAHDQALQHAHSDLSDSVVGKGREVVALHKDGSEVALRLAVGRVDDPDRPLLVGFLTDIRERLAMEHSLRRSEEELRTLMGNIPGVAFRRAAGALWHPLFVSTPVWELTGWTAADLLSHPERMPSMLLPQDVWPLEQAVALALHTGAAYSHEYRLRDRYGQIHWVSERGRGVYDESGQLLCIDGVLVDHTAIKARNAEFEGTVNAINRAMAVIEYSMDGHVLTANHNFLQLFGYALEDIQGRHFDMLSLQDAASRLRNADLWHSLQRGDFSSLECQMRARNGKTLWVQTTFNPILDANGKAFRVTQLLHDITRNRLLAAELLEQKERAEAAAAARSTFLANMSHEIRTPMNAIIGFTEALMETPLEPTQSRYLDTVHRSARSMLRLLNDILDTAKLDKGAVELEIDDFSTADLCRVVMGAHRLQAEKKQLQLLLDMAPDVPTYLRGDALRIQQILNNLMGNALKFTEQGSVQLSVCYDAQGLQLQVRDTGIGIPAHKLEHIFDPFAQADASTTRRYGGTGLGTTISRQLAELMGGSISVQSTPGQGSTFTVHLPLALGQAPDAHSAAVHSTPLPPLHVLGVDDVPQNLELLQVVLSKQGHTMDVAHDGAQAVALRQQHHYDLILMDLQMPVMDGLEAAKTIRQWELQSQQRRVPIIALSASVLDQDRRAAEGAGMDGFAAKPLELPKFMAEMARVMQSYEGAHRLALPLQPSTAATMRYPFDGSVADWATGLQLWGNAQALRHAWKRFMSEQHHRVQELQLLIQQGDWATTTAIVHRMRGAAGNLSLTAMHQLLSDMETAARQAEGEQLTAQLPALSQALAQVEALLQACATLDPVQPGAVSDDTAAWPRTPAERTAAQHALAQLAQSLQHGEIDSAALAHIQQSMPGQHTTTLHEALDMFDFESAQHAVQVLQQRLQASATQERVE